MPSSDTQFSKDNQPKSRRGKAERTLLIEAMKRQGKTLEGFYDVMVERAFNPDDNFAAKEIITRLYPIPKATMPNIQFNFDESGSLSEQASQIIKASAEGEIPPDVAGIYITAISNMIKIKELTEYEERLMALEAAADE